MVGFPKSGHICAFLDPRFKERFSIEDEPMVKLMDEIKTYGDQSEVLQASERLSQDGLQAPTKKRGKFSSIFGTSSASSSISSTGTASVSDQFKRELEIYLQYPSLDIDESPLQWWKLECKRLPLLSIAACKYLCACATSVISESVFSIGGQVVNSRRSCLKPHKVNSLIFLAKNFHSCS